MTTHKLDDSIGEPGAHFTTKLSLPKFIAVSASLNAKQRDLFKSIGFHHLRDLCCKSIPKGLILWLIRHFDVRTRTVDLPSGSSFILSSLQIHHVLGIPIRGSPLPTFCDESAKKLIRGETQCKGSYPTINELMVLITNNLDGDKFKRIFALFTLSALLCPTSNECPSPEFLQAVYMPDKIISYNWSDLVLDKLVSSISKFQQSVMSCNTATLGGCIFVLMIAYFEFLDSSELSLPDSIPRIGLWSTENVTTYVKMDSISADNNMFGKTPMRDITETPFRRRNLTQGIYIDTSNDIKEGLNSILLGPSLKKY